MKLKNKNTGEIVEFEDRNFISSKDYGFIVYANGGGKDDNGIKYHSLADLCEEWEDAPEEPKGYWYIRDGGNIDYCSQERSIAERHKQIGNYFSSKEEAEKAVEKLKAWKRLKDNGVRFCSWFYDINEQEIKIKAEFKEFEEVIVGQNKSDLDLLFSQEDKNEATK